MSFKIILCEDNGIVAVPEGWEVDNILYWPPLTGRALEKLRSNPYSEYVTSWKSENCSVKKCNIPTFREAIKFEEEFENLQTDEEESWLRLTKQRNTRFRTCKYMPAPTATEVTHSISNYDTMFINPAPSFPHKIDQPGITHMTSNSPILEEVIGTDDRLYVNQIISSVDEEIKAEIRALNSKVDDMKDFLMVEFAKLNVKCDEINKMLKTPANEAMINPKNILASNLKITLPLTTVQEVNDLEEKLLDDSFKNNLIYKLINIGGNNGNGDWSKIAYKLLYELFSYELLNCFSWTGIVKAHSAVNEPKMPFLKYTKLIDLFFEVVKLGDKQFTKTLNENFLKSGLRNAKLRLDRQNKKGQRYSTTAEKPLQKMAYVPHNNDDGIIMITPDSEFESVDDGLFKA